jgi:hypothetical protein
MTTTEKEGDLSRRERLHRLWIDQVSDREAAKRDPGGKEIALAVRTLQRAARITERHDYAEAARAALRLIGSQVPELRAEVWPERLERIEHALGELDAAALAAIDAELGNGAEAQNQLN